MGEGTRIQPFVRNATGLVREIGPAGSFMVPWLTMAGGGITFYAVQVIYAYPAGSVPLTFLILAVPNILMAVLLAMMGATMPRSAGGYVWSTRLVDPILGWFSCGYIYWLEYIFSNGLLSGIMSTVMVTIFAVMGSATHIQAFTAASNLLATNMTALYGLTFLIIILVGLASLLEIKTYMRIMYVAWIIGVIGLVVSFALLVTNYPSSIAAHWDSVWGTGSYNTIVALAAKYNSAGYVSKVSSGMWGDTMGMVGLIFYAVSGYESLTYAAGEVRNPRSSFLKWYLAGMISTAIWYTAIAWAVYNAYGDFVFKYNFVYNLFTAGSLTSAEAASVSSYMFSPNMALFAASLSSIPVVQVLASFWFWPFTNIFPQYLAANRTAFGMAFERMFPEKLAQVSERTHTPVYATLFNIFVSCVCAVLVMSVYGFLVTGANLSWWISLFYFVFCLAAMALPYKRTEIWEKGLGKKIFGIPEVTFIGGLAAAGMLWIMALSTLGISELAWNSTALWMLLGFLVLLYYIAKNKKHGLNIMDIYKEIPPP